MNEMFENCKSLISLPDLSKWDTKKLINISEIFNGCSSLISLPNISNWNKNNLFEYKSFLNLLNPILQEH